MQQTRLRSSPGQPILFRLTSVSTNRSALVEYLSGCGQLARKIAGVLNKRLQARKAVRESSWEVQRRESYLLRPRPRFRNRPLRHDPTVECLRVSGKTFKGRGVRRETKDSKTRGEGQQTLLTTLGAFFTLRGPRCLGRIQFLGFGLGWGSALHNKGQEQLPRPLLLRLLRSERYQVEGRLKLLR